MKSVKRNRRHSFAFFRSVYKFFGGIFGMTVLILIFVGPLYHFLFSEEYNKVLAFFGLAIYWIFGYLIVKDMVKTINEKKKKDIDN